MIRRRPMLAATAALALTVTASTSAVVAQDEPLKVFGAYATQIEEPWDGVIHTALEAEAEAGRIDYTFVDDIGYFGDTWHYDLQLEGSVPEEMVFIPGAAPDLMLPGIDPATLALFNIGEHQVNGPYPDTMVHVPIHVEDGDDGRKGEGAPHGGPPVSIGLSHCRTDGIRSRRFDLFVTSRARRSRRRARSSARSSIGWTSCGRRS